MLRVAHASGQWTYSGQKLVTFGFNSACSTSGDCQQRLIPWYGAHADMYIPRHPTPTPPHLADLTPPHADTTSPHTTSRRHHLTPHHLTPTPPHADTASNADVSACEMVAATTGRWVKVMVSTDRRRETVFITTRSCSCSCSCTPAPPPRLPPPFRVRVETSCVRNSVTEACVHVHAYGQVGVGGGGQPCRQASTSGHGNSVSSLCSVHPPPRKCMQTTRHRAQHPSHSTYAWQGTAAWSLQTPPHTTAQRR